MSTVSLRISPIHQSDSHSSWVISRQSEYEAKEAQELETKRQLLGSALVNFSASRVHRNAASYARCGRLLALTRMCARILKK
jgi:hypothetical protein